VNCERVAVNRFELEVYGLSYFRLLTSDFLCGFVENIFIHNIPVCPNLTAVSDVLDIGDVIANHGRK
jgi:hypothetical protein